MKSTTNRRQVHSPSPVYNLDDQDDSYEPYVPIAKRRQDQISKLGINARKPKTKRQQEEADEREDALKEEELRREKARKERTLLIEAQEVHLQKAAQGLLRLSMPYWSLRHPQIPRNQQEKRHRR
jgi:ATP-dependent RNA helicase DDX41